MDVLPEVLGDAALAAGIVLIAATVALEGFKFGGLSYSHWYGRSITGNWLARHGIIAMLYTLFMALMLSVLNTLLLAMVSEFQSILLQSPPPWLSLPQVHLVV